MSKNQNNGAFSMIADYDGDVTKLLEDGADRNAYLDRTQAQQATC